MTDVTLTDSNLFHVKGLVQRESYGFESFQAGKGTELSLPYFGQVL